VSTVVVKQVAETPQCFSTTAVKYLRQVGSEQYTDIVNYSTSIFRLLGRAKESILVRGSQQRFVTN
jgi:hypothetical protein